MKSGAKTSSLVTTQKHLIASKSLQVLLYGLVVCPFSKSDPQSLDFVVTRFLMKLFEASSD